MAEEIHKEADLLSALTAGDFKAFGMLYNKYHQALYSFVMWLSKNPHDAEELVQFVFVSVWEARQSIDPEKSFRAYLFSIARNRFFDMLRKRVNKNCYIDYVLHQNMQVAPDLEQQIEGAEINQVINSLLQQLPARRQMIFRMSREENLSYKQIAKKLQISENTVDTQIRNVLNFLRKNLPKYLTILYLWLL